MSESTPDGILIGTQDRSGFSVSAKLIFHYWKEKIWPTGRQENKCLDSDILTGKTVSSANI
ncbi:hypothetical protein BTA51_10010 [Hahella sp. CCB-MM4]|nr:hypothetical protein BTA51_10010 [Hahella sp. CCB-MM4]